MEIININNKNIFSKIKIFTKKLDDKVLFYLSLASFIIATILYILSLFYYPAIKTTNRFILFYSVFTYNSGLLFYPNFSSSKFFSFCKGIVRNIKYFHNWYIAGYFKFLCNFCN